LRGPAHLPYIIVADNLINFWQRLQREGMVYEF
jgi:hypothetical protein